MRKVQRSEILDLGAYEQVRAHFRGRLIEEKQHRRITVGQHMTFMFENHDTMLLQVQEMLRTERITDERAIAHELETYNDVVPGPHELSATLMIEYEEPAQRTAKSYELAGLNQHVFLRIGDQRIQGKFRFAPGEDESRIPAVNYLTFVLGAEGTQAFQAGAEAALVVEHPAYKAEAVLPDRLRRALLHDLTAAE